MRLSAIISMDMCEMCQNEEKYKKFLIQEFRFWRVELHMNQCYLGRCVVVLKKHREDFFEISRQECEELFAIVPKLKNALSIFKPDLFNYSSLGNEVRHVHVHVIPRYKDSITFEGQVFHDDRWGKNPSPYNKDFRISNSVSTKILSVIRSGLL